MPISEDEFKRAVEEFKEAGHESRYREQLMVQEFSLSMIATGVVLNAIKEMGSTEKTVTQILGFYFLVLLTVHLRNLNQDRAAAVKRKGDLASLLDYYVVHQNHQGISRIKAPKKMVWFSAAVASVWFIWMTLRFARGMHIIPT